MLTRFLKNYRDRHHDPRNRLLHAVGLPVTFVAPVVLLLESEWIGAAVCFLAGYGLQFLGHAFEGNDAGELILVKKLLGRPYVEFAPQRNESKNTD